MEIHAYDEMYLGDARKKMANMLQYAVYGLGYLLSDFYQMFLKSEVSHKFADGDVSIIAGKSGRELALCVTGEEYKDITLPVTKTPEYWTGWALAYYQWKKNLSFHEIDRLVSVEDICLLYNPYHEMDIEHFVERMDIYYRTFHPDSKLKTLRKKQKMTQRELAELSGVPLRTIQQYEQKQKDINMAHAISVAAMAKALNCTVFDILE